ncbi:hypothetical protein B0I35DRAFT_406091 [Stachybotrys elegans]|uniref:Uncharacterized protein n=1 Tax=Stachybotrys elegans TaxID=80388 RepID=A0A8K0T0B0_9HYPO|nr:hypothetical protein B0I35DRAFT_406091 [Stachybotrys elegans]
MGLQSTLLRALAAAPFLAITYFCHKTIDIDKLLANELPFRETGTIAWDGGSVAILPRFHPAPLRFLDELFYGTVGTFSPSTFGYDSISWWQTFTFLMDLGPLYAVFMIESCRAGNAFRAAYIPTVFLTAAQILTAGVVAPICFFLNLVFGPTASELVKSPSRRSINNKYLAFYLPLLLALHTAEILAMFLAPDFNTRHYWTYAWQMTPLWLGIATFVTANIVPESLCASIPSSPRFILALVAQTTAGAWVYMLARSPYSLAELYVPDFTPSDSFVLHTRLVLQTDQVCTFGAAALWLVYSFLDLAISGLVTAADWAVLGGLLSTGVVLGPGSAFALGWLWRETKLKSS